MSVAAGALKFGGGIESGTGDGQGACAAADVGGSAPALSAINMKPTTPENLTAKQKRRRISSSPNSILKQSKQYRDNILSQIACKQKKHLKARTTFLATNGLLRVLEQER
jgi:hypothetical protein